MTLLDLHVGRPVHRGALTLFPVWNGRAVASPGYDLSSPHVEVAERSGAAMVEQLVVTNRGRRPVLLLEGEVLEGGQQHRAASRSTLLPAARAVVLDVRCVEQGRWHGPARHARNGRRAPLGVRLATGQTGAWERVQRYEGQLGQGGTHSLLQVSDHLDDAATELATSLRPLAYQSGLLVGLGGQPLALEVYDSPRTLTHAWDALLRSLTLDALGMPALATPGRRARRFLTVINGLPLTGTDAELGTTVTGATPAASLTGLVWRHRAVHAVAVNRRHDLISA